MEGSHHHQQQQYQQYQNPYSVGIDSSGGVADRFPQWSIQETRDFLQIRAELDPTFMETKRNKALWETIASKMKEKGYNRSAEQCKCKWKNLVTRYKGCETIEQESLRQQFPFYNELQAIFTTRMQRMLWMEAEGGSKKKSMKTEIINTQLSSDDDDDNDDSDNDQKLVGISSSSSKIKKRKIKGGNSSEQQQQQQQHSTSNNLREVLEEFMKQQMQMEMQWLRSYEAREEERKMKEIEWRKTMEVLEKERIMMDRRWREREEQRRVREEARAEKRDALITALLNKLRREDT